MRRYTVSIFGALALSLAIIGGSGFRIVSLTETSYAAYEPPTLSASAFVHTLHVAPASVSAAIAYASRCSLTGHYAPFMPARAFDRANLRAAAPERYDKGRARES